MEKNGVEVIDTQQHNEQVLDLVASGDPNIVPYDLNRWVKHVFKQRLQAKISSTYLVNSI